MFSYALLPRQSFILDSGINIKVRYEMDGQMCEMEASRLEFSVNFVLS